MAAPEHIIQDAIDKDLASGKLRRIDEYKVAIEIDIDCEELLDACDMHYTRSEDDDTQNVLELELDEDEYEELYKRCPFEATNEQFIGCFLLNHELGEYVTKVTIYKPQGDNITFQ